MPRGGALLLSSLLLASALSATLGSPVKRGWTLNSAGYLLGPHAVDNHRSLQEKQGLGGKRELQPEDEGRAGGSDRPLPENDDVARRMMAFLTSLHRKGGEPGDKDFDISKPSHRVPSV